MSERLSRGATALFDAARRVDAPSDDARRRLRKSVLASATAAASASASGAAAAAQVAHAAQSAQAGHAAHAAHAAHAVKPSVGWLAKATLAAAKLAVPLAIAGTGAAAAIESAAVDDAATAFAHATTASEHDAAGARAVARASRVELPAPAASPNATAEVVPAPAPAARSAARAGDAEDIACLRDVQRRLARGDAAGALVRLDARGSSAASPFAEELAGARALAMCSAPERRAEGRRAAAVFEREHPASPLVLRIARACEDPVTDPQTSGQ